MIKQISNASYIHPLDVGLDLGFLCLRSSGEALPPLPCHGSNPLRIQIRRKPALCWIDCGIAFSSFDEEQRMYYDLLDLKVNDKMYVRHTSDSLIKRITAFYETYGDRDKLLESYYYMGRVYRGFE